LLIEPQSRDMAARIEAGRIGDLYLRPSARRRQGAVNSVWPLFTAANIEGWTSCQFDITTTIRAALPGAIECAMQGATTIRGKGGLEYRCF
jgi:hypothetical protein